MEFKKYATFVTLHSIMSQEDLINIIWDWGCGIFLARSAHYECIILDFFAFPTWDIVSIWFFVPYLNVHYILRVEREFPPFLVGATTSSFLHFCDK